MPAMRALSMKIDTYERIGGARKFSDVNAFQSTPP